MQGMPGARRPRTAWIDNIKTWTGLSVEESIRMSEDRDKWRKLRPWCGQPLDPGRLKNKTEQNLRQDKTNPVRMPRANFHEIPIRFLSDTDMIQTAEKCPIQQW